MIESADKVYDIPMEDIFCDNDFNSRGPIAPIDVVDLARSIEDVGLQQAIVVQPYDKRPSKKWRIITGHRRFVAHTVLKKPVIQAKVTKDLNEYQARKFNIIENLHRADLNILQEANALRPFWKAGFSQEMLATELGQSRGWIQIRCHLLSLPEDIQQECAAGYITQSQIGQIASIKNPELQREAVYKLKASKQAGETRPVRITQQKPVNALKKRARNREEIFEFMDLIQEVVGNSFATRCLALAAGEITPWEWYNDFKAFASNNGVVYEIPKEIREQLVL